MEEIKFKDFIIALEQYIERHLPDVLKAIKKNPRSVDLEVPLSELRNKLIQTRRILETDYYDKDLKDIKVHVGHTFFGKGKID
ncbi:hypothetical protein ACFL96_09360 [Thermoproteota archaeon]